MSRTLAQVARLSSLPPEPACVVWHDYGLVAFGVSATLRVVLVLMAVTWPLIFYQSSILVDVQAAIPLVVFAMSFATLTSASVQRDMQRSIMREMVRGGFQLALAAAVALPTTLLDHNINPKSLHIVGESAASASVALFAAAILSRLIFRLFRRSLVRRALVVGNGPVAVDIADRLSRDQLVDPVDIFPIGAHFSKDALARICQQRAVDLVLVVLPWGSEHWLREIVEDLHHLPIDVRVFPDLSRLRQEPTSISALGGLPLLGIADRPLEGWSPFLKRMEDLVLGFCCLALFVPLGLLLALAIKLDSAGPVLFRQPRVGYCNQVFEILKFLKKGTHKLRQKEVRRKQYKKKIQK